MARRAGPAVVALVAAALALAPAVTAQDTITLEAHSGEDCTGDDAFCFQVASGSLGDLQAGADVELTFDNTDTNGHNVHVAQQANADPDRQDTPASAAFASTDTVDPDASTTLTFTVPDGADGVYLWCDISGHEGGGMWLATGAGGDGGNGMPGPGALLAAAVLGGAGLLAAKRRG